MSMSNGEKFLEVTDLAVGLLNLFKGRGAHHDGGTTGTPAKRGLAELLERMVNELGLGVRDEGLFPLKLAKLDADDRSVIEAVLATHEKRLVDRLRIITINVPNPPPTIIKGRKEKKDKNDNVIDAGVADKEVPSDVDNGVEFLKSVASAVRGKSKDEQLKVLESLNIAPGKVGIFALEATKNIAKKVGKALGFPDNANTEQIFARIKELVGKIEVPNPKKPRPNDTAGWYLRMMRTITPGAFPNS
jgi:hypothetical protein